MSSPSIEYKINFGKIPELGLLTPSEPIMCISQEYWDMIKESYEQRRVSAKLPDLGLLSYGIPIIISKVFPVITSTGVKILGGVFNPDGTIEFISDSSEATLKALVIKVQDRCYLSNNCLE